MIKMPLRDLSHASVNLNQRELTHAAFCTSVG